MLRLALAFAFLLILTLLGLAGKATAQDNSLPQSNTKVHLHWGARPGVSRYRLQLAADRGFRDIVFDRIINGTETDVTDLPVGKYFWRIAALTKTGAGEFSSAAGIDIQPSTVDETASARPTPSPPGERPRTVSVRTIGGWRAAVGDVARPVVAHLRAADSVEVLATNSNGVTFALDSATGIQLWSARRPSNVPAAQLIPPLTIRAADGLDDVLVFDGRVAIKIEGKSGRELWHTELRSLPSSAVIGADAAGPIIAIVDNTRQRFVVVNGASGQLISEVRLSGRVVGAPAAGIDQDGQFFFAYETGVIELRDKTGTLIRSGSAASPATTGPLVVRGRRDDVTKRPDMILIDTREGLTGITVGDLKALGRVSGKAETSRGTLVAADLDADGLPEVMVTTQNGYLLAIRSENGKLLWETNVNETPQGIAFADLDGDRVLDVIITTNSTFATALSGRDGSPIWKDADPPESSANHANVLQSRGLVAVPTSSGILVVASDIAHTGLRAIEFPKPAFRR
jgi:outer membrane protein assembly factor BamB